MKSCYIYNKDKNGSFILDFFWSHLSKMDHTWSNLIKLVFYQSKNVAVKSFHIYYEYKNGCLIKSVQTWSNWIFHQSKNVRVKICHIYKKDKNICFLFYFVGSDLFQLDQTWLPVLVYKPLNLGYNPDWWLWGSTLWSNKNDAKYR